MTDKFSRMASLLNNPDNDKVGESLADLMDDIAVYSGIFKILYSEWAAVTGRQEDESVHAVVSEFASSNPLSKNYFAREWGKREDMDDAT